MFIIREMAFGELVGAPFSAASRFKWHGVDAWCESAPYDGAEYRPGTIVLQRLYAVVDMPPAGSGPVVSKGACVYDTENDRVTRDVTLSDPALTGAAKTAAVNAEAQRRIDAAYPPSDQIWGALLGVKLTWKKAVTGQNLTAGEATKLTAIDAAAAYIDAIRTSRLALIVGGGLTTAQIVDDANWPATP